MFSKRHVWRYPDPPARGRIVSFAPFPDPILVIGGTALGRASHACEVENARKQRASKDRDAREGRVESAMSSISLQRRRDWRLALSVITFRLNTPRWPVHAARKERAETDENHNLRDRSRPPAAAQ